jgi:hypothetical protein
MVIKAVQGKWSVHDSYSVDAIVSLYYIFVGSGYLIVAMPVIDSDLKVQISPIQFKVCSVVWSAPTNRQCM